MLNMKGSEQFEEHKENGQAGLSQGRKGPLVPA
jgi:hypothetical protein